MTQTEMWDRIVIAAVGEAANAENGATSLVAVRAASVADYVMQERAKRMTSKPEDRRESFGW